jgi:predicted transcriptional regulator
MKRPIKPSAAETAILNILWERQPCSVKTVHEILCKEKDVGYTTTAKQIQRLYEKGMVTRQAGEGKSHLYSAVVSETETKSQLFDRFVENTFGNSVSELVMHALGNEKASEQEIEAIRDFIEKLDRN